MSGTAANDRKLPSGDCPLAASPAGQGQLERSRTSSTSDIVGAVALNLRANRHRLSPDTPAPPRADALRGAGSRRGGPDQLSESPA